MAIKKCFGVSWNAFCVEMRGNGCSWHCMKRKTAHIHIEYAPNLLIVGGTLFLRVVLVK